MRKEVVLGLLGLGLVLSAAAAHAQSADAAAGTADVPAAEAEAAPTDTASSELATVPVTVEAEAAAAPTRDASRSRLIEEIIVTSQKREENLQDVPISINAFSAETLDARGIADPKDLPLATPGLTVGSQAGFTVTYLRGVGSDGFLLADPSVALYIDGIYFPFAHGQAQNFGATHAAADVAEAQALLGELTWGRMADKVIVTVGEGKGADLESYMGMVGKGGRLVFTAVANMNENDVQLNLFAFAMQQKQLVGTIFGSANPRYDIPKLLGLDREGQLDLDGLVTKTYTLDGINDGYDDMRNGKNIRGVLVYN